MNWLPFRLLVDSLSSNPPWFIRDVYQNTIHATKWQRLFTYYRMHSLLLLLFDNKNSLKMLTHIRIRWYWIKNQLCIVDFSLQKKKRKKLMLITNSNDVIILQTPALSVFTFIFVGLFVFFFNLFSHGYRKCFPFECLSHPILSIVRQRSLVSNFPRHIWVKFFMLKTSNIHGMMKFHSYAGVGNVITSIWCLWKMNEFN